MFREKQQEKPGCATNIPTSLLLTTEDPTICAATEFEGRKKATACSDTAFGNWRFPVFNKFEERIAMGVMFKMVRGRKQQLLCEKPVKASNGRGCLSAEG